MFIKADKRTHEPWHFGDGSRVTVQPAGSAGKRHVFLTLCNAVDGNDDQQIEIVLPEAAARSLGEALISGSVGIMQEFSSSSSGLRRVHYEGGNRSSSKNELAEARVKRAAG